MSAGIVAGGESLVRFPGRSANILLIHRVLREPDKPNHLEQSHVSMRNGLDLMLQDIHLGCELWQHWGIGKEGKSCLPYSSNDRSSMGVRRQSAPALRRNDSWPTGRPATYGSKHGRYPPEQQYP